MTLPDLTTEEQAVITELERRTADCVTPMMLRDTLLFYRFAKARNFNLDEAESMLRKHVAWRKEFGIDTIQTDYKPPEVLVKYIPSCLMCFDKEGCAVRYTDAGRTDVKGYVNLGSKHEIVKHFFYEIGNDWEAVMKRNKKVKKDIFFAIFDLENLTYATVTHVKTLQILSYFFQSYLDNYPETLKCAFLINVPYLFFLGFEVIKTIIPAKVIKKVRIYFSEEWKEELLKLIDADELPAYLGGKRTDPDGNPQCNTIMKRGVPIPKSCYMTREKKTLAADFEKLTILPFCKQEISIAIEEPNSHLEWEFDVKSGDIDFCLNFRGNTPKTEELIPKQRVETCYETEKGLFKCKRVGTYTIVLDNTYSWIHSKEVHYKAVINPPNDDRSKQWL